MTKLQFFTPPDGKTNGVALPNRVHPTTTSPPKHTCCCGILHVQTGTIVLGALGLCLSLFVSIVSIYELTTACDEATFRYAQQTLCGSTLFFLSSMFLVLGAWQKNRCLLLVPLCHTIVWLILLILTQLLIIGYAVVLEYDYNEDTTAADQPTISSTTVIAYNTWQVVAFWSFWLLTWMMVSIGILDIIKRTLDWIREEHENDTELTPLSPTPLQASKVSSKWRDVQYNLV